MPLRFLMTAGQRNVHSNGINDVDLIFNEVLRLNYEYHYYYYYYYHYYYLFKRIAVSAGGNEFCIIILIYKIAS
jgi:hypothetical protein